MRRWHGYALVAGIGAASLVGCELGPAYEFVVVVGIDSVAADPGDGICADEGSQCSLRAAVGEANALQAGSVGPAPHVTVRLATDVTLTLSGADENANGTGDLDVIASLKVIGDGHVLDANRLDRAIDVHERDLTVDDLMITHGRATTNGGAIRTAPGTTIGVVRSSFVDNATSTLSSCTRTQGSESPACHPSVIGGGGAIANQGSAAVFASTFERNVAGLSVFWPCDPIMGGQEVCGATWGGAVLSTGSLYVGGSTFDANQSGGPHVDFRAGAAVYAPGLGSELVASTVTDSGTGPAAHAVVAPTVRNSIIVATTCAAPVLDAGHNLVSPVPCGAPGPSGLGPLADNGGATRTRLPAFTSPAVDAIPTAECLGQAADQRGEPRPSGAACDIGAVERQPADG